VKSCDELNAWLMDNCIAYAKMHSHREHADWTVWDVFEEERPKLVAYRARFDGFHASAASAFEDVPGPLRQQQILGERQFGRTAGRDPRLRRSGRYSPGRPHRR
jgi:hypothetical protein